MGEVPVGIRNCGRLQHVFVFQMGQALADEWQIDQSINIDPMIASPNKNPEGFKLFRVGGSILPARYYLQNLINERLRGKVSPQLLWDTRNKHPYGLALVFEPENLLGLMWLQ